MRASRSERTFCYVWAYAFILFLMAPIAWMLSTSLKDQLTIFQKPPVFFGRVDFSNYWQVLSDQRFMGSLLNSVVVSAATVGVTMVLAVPASYGLSHLRSRLKIGGSYWVPGW